MRRMRLYFLLCAIMVSSILFLWIRSGLNDLEYYSNFPERQKTFVSQMISQGELQHCDGGPIPLSEYPTNFLDACFKRARIDGEFVNRAQSPLNDQILTTYICNQDNNYARFAIIQNRSSRRVWCNYRVGKSLEEVHKFDDGEFSIPPDSPSLILRALVSIKSYM